MSKEVSFKKIEASYLTDTRFEINAKITAINQYINDSIQDVALGGGRDGVKLIIPIANAGTTDASMQIQDATYVDSNENPFEIDLVPSNAGYTDKTGKIRIMPTRRPLEGEIFQSKYISKLTLICVDIVNSRYSVTLELRNNDNGSPIHGFDSPPFIKDYHSSSNNDILIVNTVVGSNIRTATFNTILNFNTFTNNAIDLVSKEFAQGHDDYTSMVHLAFI